MQSCIYAMVSSFNTSAYKNNFYIIIFTRWLQLICIFLSKLCSKYTLKLIERQESLKNRKNPRNAYKICYITLQKCKFSNLIFIFLLREIMFFVFSDYSISFRPISKLNRRFHCDILVRQQMNTSVATGQMSI